MRSLKPPVLEFDENVDKIKILDDCRQGILWKKSKFIVVADSDKFARDDEYPSKPKQ